MGDLNYITTALTGTPIGRHHFIAAKHLGGTVGDALFLNCTSYTTASNDDTGSDLRIWEVSGTPQIGRRFIEAPSRRGNRSWSSGAVFIQEASAWKPADVALDIPLNTTDSGVGFSAAIFDLRVLNHTNGAAFGYTSTRIPR